jgi:uncharacterized protein (TIGR00106 family)
MLVEFSMSPVGEGVSLSQYVAEVIRIIEESGLPHETHAMGTLVEGDWDEVMALIRKCHTRMLQDTSRVLTTIKIDDRKGARGRLKGKIESLEKKIGHKIS